MTKQTNDKVEAARPLPPYAWALFESKVLSIHIDVPVGVTWEQVMHPMYLTHVQSKLKAGNQIRFTSLDRLWMCDAIVLNVSDMGVQLLPLPGFPLSLDVAWKGLSDIGDVTIQWNVGEKKYRVIRSADNQVIHSEEKKADCVVWCEQRDLNVLPEKREAA